MPPGDSLFGSIDSPQENKDNSETNKTEKPSGGVTLTEEQWKVIQERDEQLNKQLTDSQNALAEATQSLRQFAERSNGSPQATPAPADKTGALSPDEALKMLADDPLKFVDARADGRISNAIAEQLRPLLVPLVEAQHQTMLDSERRQFDSRFGTGKFDEIVMPDLGKTVSEWQKNGQVNLLSDKSILQSHIHKIVGMKRDDINKAEEEFKTTQKKTEEDSIANIVNQLPVGSIPKNRGSMESLDQEARSFLKSVEESTGDKTDEKIFSKLHSVGNTIDDYLAVKQEISGSKSAEGNN